MDITSLSSVSLARQPTINPVGRAADTGSGAAASASTTPSPDATKAAPAYISPYLSYDPTTHLLITQYRDADSGKVRLQIPAEKVVEAYRRIAAYGAAAVPNAAGVTAPVSGPLGAGTGTAGGQTTGTTGTGTGTGTGWWGTGLAAQTGNTVSGVAAATTAFDASAALMESLPPTAMAIAQASQDAAGSASLSLSLTPAPTAARAGTSATSTG